MSRFVDLSIKKKLAVLNFVTTGATLVLAGSALAVYGVQSYRQTLARQLSTQADMIAFSTTPALVFNDEKAAADTLAALRAEPRIAFAGIYTPDGRNFATYTRSDVKGGAAVEAPERTRESQGFQGAFFKLSRRIGPAGRPLGYVFLRADLVELTQQVLRYVGITVAFLTISLLASGGIALVLQREIARPVLDLVTTARTVTLERNYRVRATARSRDELGVLVGAFNDMLDEIQNRDTELRAVNRELAQRTQELSRKNEEVEAFVYIVSHDLRGPLVNLQGFSRELQRSCQTLAERLQGATLAPNVEREVKEILESEVPGSLRFISASTSKFERLINALLALSRTGRREFRVELLDMNELLAATLDSLKLGIEATGAQVLVSPLPPARGDATAVGQVLSNLVSNSVRYLQPGRGGRIEIGGVEEGGANRYFVKDNGVGIPEAAKKKLFQVFQRFHPDLAEGEGIGLATVKVIVERHGGRIWAESTEGQGTTFHFTLPQDGAAERAER